MILLLLAGDIQTHPGPTPDNANPKCMQPESNNTTLTCETCQGKCQVLLEKNKENGILSNNFEWICPNTACQPNHKSSNDYTIEQTSNKFAPLPEKPEIAIAVNRKKTENDKTKCKRKKSKVKVQSKTKSTKEKPKDENLLKTLTKISSSDYIGKEICRACHKNIAKVQKAISCDICERWTHLNCSDMTQKTYNQHKNIDFPWVCNTCRTSEVKNKDIMDKGKLKPEQLPIENSSLSPDTKEDPLILHYNSRSVPNKCDDINYTIDTLKPSIVVYTESWFDASFGPNAYVPEGYKIIRQDRSDQFKQKYGKNNGGGIALMYKEDLKVSKINTFSQVVD